MEKKRKENGPCTIEPHRWQTISFCRYKMQRIWPPTRSSSPTPRRSTREASTNQERSEFESVARKEISSFAVGPSDGLGRNIDSRSLLVRLIRGLSPDRSPGIFV